MEHQNLSLLQDPFDQLKDLRLFYVYQQYIALPQDRHSCDCNGVVSQLHHFASRFFGQLHSQCPQLHVLLWGFRGGLSNLGGTPFSEEMNDSAPVRQHIFAKQIRVQPDGSLLMSAGPAPRTWVRAGCPDLDLLQHDPGLRAGPGGQLLGW